MATVNKILTYDDSDEAAILAAGVSGAVLFNADGVGVTDGTNPSSYGIIDQLGVFHEYGILDTTAHYNSGIYFQSGRSATGIFDGTNYYSAGIYDGFGYQGSGAFGAGGYYGSGIVDMGGNSYPNGILDGTGAWDGTRYATGIFDGTYWKIDGIFDGTSCFPDGVYDGQDMNGVPSGLRRSDGIITHPPELNGAAFYSASGIVVGVNEFGNGGTCSA